MNSGNRIIPCIPRKPGKLRLGTLLVCMFLLIAPAFQSGAAAADPLPSWNEGRAKSAVLDFVRKVTDPSSPSYAPLAERIATFDNDGTLWAEQPLYFQFVFAVDTLKDIARHNPELKNEEPFRQIFENDPRGLMQSGKETLAKILLRSHAGMTSEDFERTVNEWLAKARHPRFNRPYTDLVYQPMLEVLAYLRENGFKTYIVSGGGVDFMRPCSEKIYGIPREQVIGSSLKTKYQVIDGKPVIMRLPHFEFIDDGEGKPVGIDRYIGRRPIAAFGNSDGDLEMLQWTAAGKGPRLMMLIHHTDAEREWAYDRQSHIGKLDKALDEAQKQGWTVVDMKNDFRRIFPFEPVK